MSLKPLLSAGIAAAAGFIGTYAVLTFALTSTSETAGAVREIASSVGIRRHEVIGFLPYWLLDKADKDYAEHLTTLTYFGLTVQPDGTIQKYTNPGESEPGWYALQSGTVQPFLDKAKADNLTLSLLIFSGHEDAIAGLMTDPVPHAQMLMEEVTPVMRQYGFTDLNIDIESVIPEASSSARSNFTVFMRELRRIVDENKLGTITIDVSPTDLIRQRLINLEEVAPLVDSVVLMTYDYHYTGSAVTGPVAPVGGAGIEAEFDIETGIQKALEFIPKTKVVLGVPLYGYEWESTGNVPRTAVMPGSGLVISNRRIEQFLKECASCSAQLDAYGKESYLIYLNQATGMYHHVFFPDRQAMQEKINVANRYGLGGLALWALGYDGDTIMEPLRQYRQTLE